MHGLDRSADLVGSQPGRKGVIFKTRRSGVRRSKTSFWRFLPNNGTFFVSKPRNSSSVFISKAIVFVNTMTGFANKATVYINKGTVFTNKQTVLANRMTVLISKTTGFANSVIEFANRTIGFPTT